MTDDRARLSTTIPVDVDGDLRVFCVQRRLPMSVVTSVFLRFGLDRLDDADLIAALDDADVELGKIRTERGRKAMESRYGKEGNSP